MNTLTKAVYVTHLSDAQIIQLNIFKYSDIISKKVFPNLSIDKEILLLGNRMAVSGIIYCEEEQSHYGHHTSGVKVNSTWFFISDTRILRIQKLLCSSKDISVSYILICEKITNFLTALPNSLNGTAEVGPAPELITDTANNMIRQSILQELESKINHCSESRETGPEQSQISSEEKVKIQKS